MENRVSNSDAVKFELNRVGSPRFRIVFEEICKHIRFGENCFRGSGRRNPNSVGSIFPSAPEVNELWTVAAEVVV